MKKNHSSSVYSALYSVFYSAFYSILYSVKHAYLSLKQKPNFVFSVVSTMGLTLGALLCVLTLAYVMLFKPLPYPDQDKLFIAEQIQFDQSKEQNVKGFNYPALVNFYQHQQIFSNAALIDYGESSLINLANTPIVKSSFVTPEWFSLTAAKTIKGRGFELSEALNTYNPVAVISYSTWDTVFSLDPNIIGKSIYTRNQSYTIVGVLDKAFIEPKLNSNDFETHIWFPWDYNTSSDNARETWWGRAHKRTIIGKLSKNYSVSQAQATSSEYVNRIWQEHIVGEAFFAGWQVKIELTSFLQRIIGNIEPAIYMLIAGTVCLTLIASLNIINLLMARFTQRQQQTAIYAALGAKRVNLFAQLFSENILLFFLSLTLALFVSMLGFSILQQYLTSFLPRINELSLQFFTGLTAVVLGILLSFVFSFFLLKTLNYKNLVSLLTSANKGVSSAVSQRKRKIFVLSQISIAFVLVFITSITAWQSIALITFDDGMNTDNLQSLQIRMEADVLPTRAEMHELVEQAKNKFILLPEVNNVSRSNSPFLMGLDTWSLTELTTLKQVQPEGKNVDEHYFSLSGQQLLAGELFIASQSAESAKVLVINQTLAKILSVDENVIGRKLSFGTSAEDEYAFTIIGIVSDHHIAGQSFMPPRVYRPNKNLFSMMIETTNNNPLSRASIEKVLGSISPIFKVHRIESLAKQKDKLLMPQYITVIVSITLMLLTISLASIGLYGILSYSTQMRRFEIGTRLAIGAKRRDIITLIIKDNASAIIIGFIASIVSLIMFSLLFREQLHDYLNWQLLPLALITLGLICIISFIACYLPLRQYINKPASYSLRGYD